ncbi:MAG: helix-turn-helix domain-containing protein [Elusimicrobiota bacterium]
MCPGVHVKDNEVVFDAAGVAEYLKIKKNTIYIWVSQKRVPYVKIGRRTVFLKREIDRWLRENLVKENIII